jgi:NTE family protein
MAATESNRIAIACQGGGSHTAYTAGVLQAVLPSIEASEHELVGISGTSGGAMTAATAWYGLQTGGADRAVELLDTLWTDLAASHPVERGMNQATITTAMLENWGAPLPQVSPYQMPLSKIGKEMIGDTLRDVIDFDELPALVGPETPSLVIGSVDVTNGEFVTFVDDEVTESALLASAAIPTLFEAVEIDDRQFLDGLLSKNPPVEDFIGDSRDQKPDELWVVQVNPDERDAEPQTMFDIEDRRNELAGNLSMTQQLEFIETVNEWIRTGVIDSPDFKEITIRSKQLRLQTDLDHVSKLDRDASFISDLQTTGQNRAEQFVESVL